MNTATAEAPRKTARTDGNQTPILEIENLHISFYTRAGEIPAVMDFSCKVMPGESMGIVGESGCGKSTVALGIMRDMGNRGHIKSGKIRFKGRDMGEMSDAELRHLRGSKIAMIYQEPMASLNPAMKIGRQLMEVPIIHENVSKDEAWTRSLEMLEAVRLPDPERLMRSFPHQLSGGQQQRAVIARALVLKPDFVVCDEPVSALDVSIQAQVINLLRDMQQRYGLTYLFISHDLSVVRHSADRIGVMYLGRLVELADGEDLFQRPLHPYTRALIAAVPIPDPRLKRDRHLLRGDPPSPFAPPPGCHFHTRCPHAQARCRAEVPALRDTGGGHRVACHFAERLAQPEGVA